ANEWAETQENPGKDWLLQAVSRLIASDTVEQRVAAQWNKEVSLWHDQKLNIAEPYSFDDERAFDLIDESNVQVDAIITLVRKLPCEVLEQTLQCVEVEYRYQLDSAHAEALNERLIERASIEDAE